MKGLQYVEREDLGARLRIGALSDEANHWAEDEKEGFGQTP